MKRKQPNTRIFFSLQDQQLRLQDKLEVSNASIVVEGILEQTKGYQQKNLEINLDDLRHLDSIGVAALNYIQKYLRKRGIRASLAGGTDEIQKKVGIFSFQEERTTSTSKKQNIFEEIGDGFFEFITDYAYSFIVLTANVVYWSVTDLFKRKMQRKGEFYNQAVLIGVNATWIVGALAFIIGLVLALQSSAQLRNFGANIYIVDLTVISMMSEMGPLITAILVAGRSGSSITAEIATMKVTSELDALKTMGLNPVRFVVIPKMHGSLLTLPFLTMLANIMGILGGMLIAYTFLDITPQVFINRMTDSLYTRDILIGIFKSLVFASLIVLTGTFFGLRVQQGAEGVGKVTTTAVVTSIALVMIADSIMGLLFY